jgi:hypothetical protein
MQDPIQENIKPKRAGCMAEVVSNLNSRPLEFKLVPQKQ